MPKIQVEVKSNLSDFFPCEDFMKPDNYFVIIGVDYNETPFILKDADNRVIRYRDIKRAKSMQAILNMGHLAHYYIEEITE